MGDPEIETIHLLHDGIELLAGGGSVDAVPGELGGGAQTGERIAQAVGHRGSHLADRRQLLGLHQLGARLPQLLGHAGEGPRQVADLVRGSGHDGLSDRVFEVARADDGHGVAQLGERARQVTRDEPGRDQARHERDKHGRPEDAALRLDDAAHLGHGALHAELARLTIDLAVHAGERRLQPLEQLAPRDERRLIPPTGIVQLEHPRRDRLDVGFDAAHGVGQLDLVGGKVRRPAIEPEVHDLHGEREFLLGGGIAAQVAPDDLRLVEHRVFDVRVGARARQALAQRFQRAALQGVGADRLHADEQGREDHQGKTQQQLALESHRSKLPHKQVLRLRACRALLSSPL